MVILWTAALLTVAAALIRWRRRSRRRTDERERLEVRALFNRYNDRGGSQ